ncbi:MAG: WD40 repeat domain-containing protein [Limisphaerales bacterium]
MKIKLLLCLALVLAGGMLIRAGGQTANDNSALKRRLQELAQSNQYFSLTVVIYERPLRLWPPMQEVTVANGTKIWRPGTNQLAVEQLILLHRLHALSGNREGLIALLASPDPKVRTLALGALFQREDGRDLPLIASLLNDFTPTFPDLHDSMNQAGGPRPMSELTNSQTVSDVAQRMLAYWGVGHSAAGGYGRVTSSDFAAYWKKYAGRDHSAYWFAVKMKRATRQTIPIQPEYQPDIRKVLAEMKALPMPERAWTELYVLAPEGWYESEPGDMVVPADELPGMIKGLGPDALLRFLQRRRVSDDPDLVMGEQNSDFIRMSNFILLHADKLLNTNDAEAVLACEYAQRDSGGINPAWPIGAALLQPGRAHEILQDALAHETRTYETAAGELAGALWRIGGPAEIPFLVNWFYTVLPTASEPMHQPVAFLWGVEAAGRPDTRQLIAALVKDPRFDHTDWDTLKELLTIVNANRSTPLVKERDIYDAQPQGLLDERIVLATWRNLLRREYGLAAEPLPASPAAPEQVLTQPTWSAAIPKQKDYAGQWRLLSSPDGKWLALLSHEVVTIWRTDTGNLAWQLPSFPVRVSDYPPMAGNVAFMAADQLLTFDHGDFGRFLTWDLATRQETSKVLLKDKPTSGVDDGRYSFDGGAHLMAFAGYNDLGCFDTRTGAALWMHPHEGGVNIPIALSADGRRLAVGGGADYPQVARLYDAVTGKRLRQFDSPAGRVLALAISSNGWRLVTATAADGLQLWDCTTGKLLRTFAWQVPGWGMGEPVFSADGQWLAAMGYSSAIGAHQIGIFNTDTGRLKWVIRFQTDSSFGADIPLAFSPDGKTFYTAADQIEAWPLK